ncbi:probable helicase MAGATAMA 3 isoform X2 [Ricinus communis]|uniref:probable helicase MAGATAMA 3 isoform X2 n=1 Tax=Ricinus communis TaxID=3988 RepID=UPI000D68E62E|nr:probable helicase MAGATAMA 3 isoform X2 [Ricinus communis]|eukprot:XP_025013172.1 probable helicase MAGATAMA 3 isoform X2 [Ricinus communis]
MAVDVDKLLEEASFARFCKIVLGWDYFSLLKEYDKEKQKERGKSDNGDATSGLRQVKNSYKDVDEYLETFEPLLFEEVKAQIIQRKDDEEVTTSVMRLVLECNEAEGFLFPAVSFGGEEDERISQNDLLLLSKEKIKDSRKLPEVHAFALVEHRQHDRYRLRMFLDGEVRQLNFDNLETHPRLLKMRAFMTAPRKPEEKPIFSLKICSLSTISREYLALRSISSLPFKDLILKATDINAGSEEQAWKVSVPLREYFKGNLNKSQLEAINAGLSRKAFVLIQGPPGTGKTQTILALLSVILHASPARVLTKGTSREIKRGPALPIQEKYNHWARASPWMIGNNPRDNIMPKDGDDGYFPTTGNELKPEVVASNRRYRVRILVCAPSNSALDEIVLRLLRFGVRDENIHTYNPKIVRIGLKAHHSVQSVCMDYLVKQKQGESAADKQKHGAVGGDTDTIRTAILDEAVIVFSTLSFSGSAMFSKLNHGFDVVIIDEAAQAVEPATLVPLANGCKQVFLVGDPKQLPATVISPIAEKFGYKTSLFERLQRAGYPVNMLKMQYRMHPQDAEKMDEKTKRDWHEYRCFGPFCFFDIHEGKESQPSGSGSWVNNDEVDFVLHMYHKLVTMHPKLRSSSQFAIISPYRNQVKLLQDRFRDMFGQESEQFVDIQTVDGFQGREKDVAIFSCVRANKDRGIGFVSDSRRMNVGITRAKSTVLVVGSASTLKSDESWKRLVESAEQRGVLFKVDKPYDSFFSDSNLESMKTTENLPGRNDEDQENDMTVAMQGNVGDADQGQEDDYDHGDDDMDDAGPDDD